MPGSWVSNLHLLSRAQSSLAQTAQAPTSSSLTVRLVCIIGLGFTSFNPLFGSMGSGCLPLWGREAQRCYTLLPKVTDCGAPRPRLEPRSFNSRSSVLPQTPGLCLSSQGSTSHVKPHSLCLKSFLESIKLKKITEEGRFYYFVL